MNSRPFRLVLALLAVAGCGGSKPPPAAPSPANAAPASSGADAEAAPGEEGDDADADDESDSALPRGKVLRVTPLSEKTPYLRVRVMFKNPTSSVCRFTSYTLIWPGGKKTVTEKPFEIPPGGRRQRSLKVYPDDGDIGSLTKSATQIDVAAGCSKP